MRNLHGRKQKEKKKPTQNKSIIWYHNSVSQTPTRANRKQTEEEAEEVLTKSAMPITKENTLQSEEEK
jgi:hypothetical protein